MSNKEKIKPNVNNPIDDNNDNKPDDSRASIEGKIFCLNNAILDLSKEILDEISYLKFLLEMGAPENEIEEVREEIAKLLKERKEKWDYLLSLEELRSIIDKPKFRDNSN